MPTLTIRCSDEQYTSIQAAAQAAGASMESWARDLLTSAAAAPVVRKMYAYRGMGPGSVIIKRISDNPGGTVATGQGWTQEVADAVNRAKMLVRRNEPGDRENAVALLKEHFKIAGEVGI